MQKGKNPQLTPIVMGLWGNEHSRLLLAGVATCTIFWKAVPLFIKILNVLPWPSSRTCRIYPIETLNKPIKTHEQGCLGKHRCSGVKGKTIQMPLSKGTDKEVVVYLYSGLWGHCYIEQNTHFDIKKIRWISKMQC